MHIHRRANCITVQAPAKLNLFFEVLGKRSDGFHEIETLMVPISLYDSLMCSPDPGGRVTLESRWAGHAGTESPLGTLPSEAENLATCAVNLLRSRAGVTQGAALRLVKRIPAAAGLGGGSSDAAAALLAANAAWQLDWSTEQLMPLAAELGSDVPFFLAGGAAICRGRGELVEPLGRPVGLHAVVVRPPVGLGTAEVYRRCRPGSPPRSVARLTAALAQGDLRRISAGVFNRLEQAAEELSPWIGRLQREFARLDCVAAQMSGSGTSYFGVCHHAHHARRVAGRLRSSGVGRVFAVRL